MIIEQLIEQIESLHSLLKVLTDDQYVTKIIHLRDATIGAHVRHSIELLQCVRDGYSINKIDYVNRYRNLEIEKNKLLAQNLLIELKETIYSEDKELQLINEQANLNTPIKTTYFREIVYNTEHTIHHLALIKVALLELNLNIVDENFGMAYSTIQYNASLAKDKQ